MRKKTTQHLTVLRNGSLTRASAGDDNDSGTYPPLALRRPDFQFVLLGTGVNIHYTHPKVPSRTGATANMWLACAEPAPLA